MASIGVYICHCGRNIAAVVDVERLREVIAADPRVAIARSNTFCCAEPGQKQIQQDILEAGVDRVLVAACSPRLHEPTFRRTIEQAGLNRYLVEMANIREQCSWVHGPEAATDKALDLLRMALARLELLPPLSDRQVPVTRRALVVGGGVAGLQAALALADMKVPVLLLEQSSALGGQARQWHCPAPTDEPFSCSIDPLATRAFLHPLIDLRLGTELAELRGTIGGYRFRLKPPGPAPAPESESVSVSGSQSESESGSESVSESPSPSPPSTPAPSPANEPTVGAVIVATGFAPYQPTADDCPWADLPGVISSTALEQAFQFGPGPFAVGADQPPVTSVAFLQCVGSRLPERYPHCSRICCAVTLKQALALRRAGIQVSVFHSDLRLFHKDQEEDLYQRARRAGVLFQRGELTDVAPAADGRLGLAVRDEFLGTETIHRVDRLVLAVGLRPRDDAFQLRQTLKLAASEDGFLLEAHPKLQPLETAMDGIFLAGCCQGPKDLRETTASALGAAAKAHQILSQDHLQLDGLIAAVDPESCAGCGTCEEECPYQAIVMVPGAAGKAIAQVQTAACKGCGVCAGACPTAAADLLGFSEPILTAQVRAALEREPATKIVAFCCNWCAYAGADSAGTARLAYPANVRIIRVPCSGRINARLVLAAFEAGAGRVLVAGCHPPGDCHYISGNLRFAERIPKIRRRLQKRRFDPNHFQVRWISATEGPQFQKTIRELAADLDHAE